MIEKGIRGGLSVVTRKFSKANNEYLPDYNPSKPSTYCMYFDANNLYGWAMSQKMPYQNLHWITDEATLQAFDVLSIEDEADVGYILEVDLLYPKQLHDRHNDFPLAPIQRVVQLEEWSTYTKELAATSTTKTTTTTTTTTAKQVRSFSSKIPKLIADLHNKTNYVVHYQNLKLYLRLGLKVSKIHKIIGFDQSNWLSSYIQLNTRCRQNAKNAFEKDFFKLMNNSVFGKTMENVRNRHDIRLVNDNCELHKLTKRPQFKTTRIITPDLVSVQSLTTRVKMFKPIFIGFCVLDISKTLMFSFHYDVIKAEYGEKAQLCFTDTDSLLYCIETDDVYVDMKQNQNYYDTSDYPKDHPLYDDQNKKVIGKMKDEMAGKQICEFVGLRSKMYSIKTAGGIEKQKAKGVCRATIRKCLRHAMYADCLWSGKTTREVVRSIRSVNHQLFSTVQLKVALSSFDDKRFVLDDKMSTRAHGHFRNNQSEQHPK